MLAKTYRDSRLHAQFYPKEGNARSPELGEMSTGENVASTVAAAALATTITGLATRTTSSTTLETVLTRYTLESIRAAGSHPRAIVSTLAAETYRENGTDTLMNATEPCLIIDWDR